MEWICSIALFLVLSGILLELIADSRYYKFARWVSGVIVILQVIRPFTATGELWQRFASAVHSFNYAVGSERVLEEIYQVNGQTSGKVLQTYKETVAVQIAEILKNNGLLLKETEMEVEDNGKIRSLQVLACYQDEPNKKTGIHVPTVVPVTLKEPVNKKTVSPMELYIREILAEFYRVEENKIVVVIQEAE